MKRFGDGLGKLVEKRASCADIMNNSFQKAFGEVFNEFINTATSRALKYQISIEEAAPGILKGLLTKDMAFTHANMADIMMRNKESVNGEFHMEYKLHLFEMESYFFNIAQNRDLPQAFKQIVEDKDTVVMVTELVRERIEIIQTKFNNGYGSLTEGRSVCKEVFNLVMDVISNLTKQMKQHSLNI